MLDSQPKNLEIDLGHLVEENENLRKEIKVYEARNSRLQNEKSALEQENEGYIQLCVSADLLWQNTSICWACYYYLP